VLSLALPKGSSLERRTLDLFAAAGLRVRRPSDHTYRAEIEYAGLIQVAFYKPREIPDVVESGTLDLGLTGGDWVEESGAKVETVTSFTYAKTYDAPWRVVLAVPAAAQARTVGDLDHGIRVATEYPSITRRFFQDAGVRAEVVQSYGATEAKIPELADAVVDVVETGTALRHNGLRVIETIRTCTPQLIAAPSAWNDAEKRATIQGVARLLSAVRAGTSQVLLTVQVPERHMPQVAPLMSAGAWRAGSGLFDADLVVLQGLAGREGLPETIDRIMAAGAVDVVEADVGKVLTTRENPHP
jgi:ATP phosphoribosyltransferase